MALIIFPRDTMLAWHYLYYLRLSMFVCLSEQSGIAAGQIELLFGTETYSDVFCNMF